MASKASLVVMTPRSVPADILKENAKHYWPEDPRHRRPALADRWRCCLGQRQKIARSRKPADHCQRNLRAELCGARTGSHSLPRGVPYLRRLAIVSMQPGEHRRLTLPVTAI